MPPRLMIGAIVLFWLGMTGWLIQREVVPIMLAEVSPTYVIDLTDEIGSPMVGWVVSLDGKRVGSGISKIVANDDHTFEFHSTVRFDDFKIALLQIDRMNGLYRVTEEGKLLSFRAQFEVNKTEIGIKGDVKGDAMEPVIFMNKLEQKFDKIDIRQEGSIVNPMHPVNRLRGLRKGQIWKVTLLDPLRGAQDKLMGQIAKHTMAKPALIAEVKTDTLAWDRKEVPCYKIEYFEPGKDDIVARTWARRSDGLVLQQEAAVFGMEMISQRIPN